jgi:hypothetical protein
VTTTPRVERVEQHAVGLRHEVPGEPDPVDGEADAAPHLDRQHGERDRNAEPAVEDVVQAAVARVVVVVRVAREALLREEHVAEPVDVALPDAPGEVVETVEDAVGLEVGVLDLRDQQRAAAEVDLLRGHPDQLTERPQRIHQQPGA